MGNEMTVPLTCWDCGAPTDYCDSIPSASVEGTRRGECGYRLVALCWFHGAERKQVATSRVREVLRCERQGFARLDRGRAGGGCICPDCGRDYHRHPRDADYEFLNVLCDGSLVKL